jgi:phenylacetate-coenzyme A ligase PaaK-like adenylate-forming protein
MFELSDFLNLPPYSLAKAAKTEMLTAALTGLTCYHYRHCQPYQRMLAALSFDQTKIKSYLDIPFLPVRLFKEFDLLSVAKTEVVKTMTSSGTTGQQVSKIFLDRETAANQQKTLVKIIASWLGSKRLPMIILDSSTVIRDRAMFSARGAGILGFSMFGSDKIYAFDENMQLDIEKITAFLKKHQGEAILLFGFTFMIWRHFYQELVKTGYRPDLTKGVLLHGGGWKKLIAEAVSPQEFKQCLRDVCGITRIHDYYGMVEQTGSIYIECEVGHLHASIFSDVITRRYIDFFPCERGEKGIVEVVSVLPGSYPGHALLTEDEGTILGEDDCPCGRLGKYFKIDGRLQNAEIRGCSDTYAAKFR